MYADSETVMKIGIDLRMGDPEYGIGRYGLELTKALLEADKENRYVLFVRDVMKFRKAGFEHYSNARLVEANYRHYSIAEQVVFPMLLLRQDLDLMHFLNFNVPLAYRKPYVVTIHDVVHVRLPGNKRRRVFHRIAMRTVLQSAADHAKRVLTVSQFSKREIVDVLKTPAYKIDVIYEAATPVTTNESDTIAARQRFGINKPYVLFVGVMERKKNLISLARGFDMLKEKYQQNIQLVIAGKKDVHYPEIANSIKAITYGKDVILTGVVSDREKYSLLKGSLAFVSASLFEGFGLPGLEAMSVGVPLVVANTDVFNEVYDNGAIYFDPVDPSDIAQKLFFILNDEKYRAQVANHAYVRAQSFSWHRAALQTLASYEKALRV
jgi:glycosyltransferase involved in cell wall biosynthesis